MRQDQINLLYRYNIKIYNENIDNLLKLQEILKEEIDLRQAITSKEQAIKLAEKVQAESGNDQHIDTLKQELFSARQSYALRISGFDSMRHQQGYVAYNYSTGLPYDTEDENLERQQRDAARLAPIDDGNHLKSIHTLKPIEAEETPQERPAPQWRISTIEDDGTETVIGYS